MEEDNYYLKCYIPTSDIKYITSNNTLIIDKKLYKYEVIKISEDYFSDNVSIDGTIYYGYISRNNFRNKFR